MKLDKKEQMIEAFLLNNALFVQLVLVRYCLIKLSWKDIFTYVLNICVQPVTTYYLNFRTELVFLAYLKDECTFNTQMTILNIAQHEGPKLS